MAQGASNDDATRGKPYYEKLRKDLKQSIVKKRELDNKLVREFLGGRSATRRIASCSLHGVEQDTGREIQPQRRPSTSTDRI